tara:strand:+ start:343 stop:582 length:240 start_codon:yes stop_codon:yes gene_type:complete
MRQEGVKLKETPEAKPNDSGEEEEEEEASLDIALARGRPHFGMLLTWWIMREVTTAVKGSEEMATLDLFMSCPSWEIGS